MSEAVLARHNDRRTTKLYHRRGQNVLLEDIRFIRSDVFFSFWKGYGRILAGCPTSLSPRLGVTKLWKKQKRGFNLGRPLSQIGEKRRHRSEIASNEK
jgi:hypothetical protein